MRSSFAKRTLCGKRSADATASPGPGLEAEADGLDGDAVRRRRWHVDAVDLTSSTACPAAL